MELLISNIILTSLLTGLIWTIQIVHYPSFLDVSEISFKDYHRRHTWRISILVIPLMLAELAGGLLLIWHKHDSAVETTQLILLGAIWLCTLCISAPLHNKMTQRYLRTDIQLLIATNWLRTTLWTARLGILTVMLLVGSPYGN